MAQPVEGGCLCGAVRYRLDSEPLISGTCHCRSCRRASAAPIVGWLHVDERALVFTAGRPTSYRSSEQVTRTFCGRCGTPLTYRRDDYGPAIDVTTCSLDVPDAFPPVAHTWTRDRIGWLKLADDLPCLEEGPPLD